MHTETIAGKAIRKAEEAFRRLDERMRSQQEADVLRLQEEWTETIGELAKQFPAQSFQLLEVEAHLDAFAFVLRRSSYLVAVEHLDVLVELGTAATTAVAAMTEQLEITQATQSKLQQTYIELLLQAVEQHRRLLRFRRKVEEHLLIAELAEMIDQPGQAVGAAQRLEASIDMRQLDRLAV